MICKIIIPTQDTYLLQLPPYLIGKNVEILAFEVRREPEMLIPLSKESRIQYLKQALERFRVDLSNFKFNRDEANDYD